MNCKVLQFNEVNIKNMDLDPCDRFFAIFLFSKKLHQQYILLIIEWDIPCIARVMVRITFSGGVSNLSQRAGWNNF